MEITTNFIKNISFDWFKFSTNQVRYNEDYKKVKDLSSVLKLGESDSFLNDIFNILSSSRHYKEYEISYRKESRFEFGVLIDEGISASFFGPRLENEHYQTLFNMTGKGCYYWSLSQKTSYAESWFNLFNFCRKHNMKYNRLDIALDLIGHENVEQFIQWLISKIKNGYCKTPYRYAFNDEHTSPNGGYSLYLGSPAGDSRVRIYNKNAEKTAKDSNAFIEDDCYWRIELQLTNTKVDMISDFINAYCLYFENKDFELFNQFIYNFFDRFIHVHNKDNNNISRCSIDPIWKNFISYDEEYSSISLADKTRRSSYEIKKDWFNRSCGKIFSLLYFIEGKEGIKNFLKPLLLSNLENADDEFISIVRNYYNSQRLFFNNDDLENNLNNLIESLKE